MSPAANAASAIATKTHDKRWTGRLRTTPTTTATAAPKPRRPHKYTWQRGTAKTPATNGTFTPRYTHDAFKRRVLTKPTLARTPTFSSSRFSSLLLRPARRQTTGPKVTSNETCGAVGTG